MNRLWRQAGFWYLGATTLAAAVPDAAREQQAFVQLHTQARQHYEAHEYEHMAQSLQQALNLRPGHPGTLYNLAAAKTLQGQGAQALTHLQLLAKMKLAYPLHDDPDFSGLQTEPRFQALAAQMRLNGGAVGSAQLAFSIGTPDFLPEGIAYDPQAREFFVGSVQRRTIARRRSDGREDRLVAEGEHGLWSVLGMTTEPAARLLWAASAALPQMRGYSEALQGRSGIFGFDLDSGALRARHLLPADAQAHALGDVIAVPGGALYASDSAAGQLWRIDRDSGGFEALTPPGALVSPQGLTLAADGKRLYVADYARGLFVLDLASRRLAPVGAPAKVCLYGIDGLYRYRNSLVAIQNGTRPQRVMRFALDLQGAHIGDQRVLLAGHPEFDEPTLGVMVKGRLYLVANSQWNRLGADGTLVDDGKLRKPAVLILGME